MLKIYLFTYICIYNWGRGALTPKLKLKSELSKKLSGVPKKDRCITKIVASILSFSPPLHIHKVDGPFRIWWFCPFIFYLNKKRHMKKNRRNFVNIAVGNCKTESFLIYCKNHNIRPDIRYPATDRYPNPTVHLLDYLVSGQKLLSCQTRLDIL